MAMLKVDGLNVGYGKAQVIWNVSFSVEEGEIVSIVGGNGAGKSTVAKTICGILRPMSGSIRFKGEEIGGRPTSEILEKGLVYIPEGRQLFRDMTVVENLEMGAMTKRAKENLTASIKTVFGWFPRLEERKSQAAGTMSGGEQQMLAIARGYVSMADLLLFDEPSLGLAPKIVNEILAVLQDLKKSGKTIILIEQDVRKALKNSEHAFVLENGAVKLSGTAESLMHNDEVKKAYLGI